MAIKICLDAGHYGKYNPSPVVPGYYESDMTWALHLKLKARLEEYDGVEVITTRADKDKDLDLVSRGKASKGCNLFISLHSNGVSGADKEYVDYPVVYYPISNAEAALANDLAKLVQNLMGTTQPGRAVFRKSDNGNWDYYSVIYGATAVGTPGLIIEHSFHTNTKATKWLMVDANLDKLAEEEAALIAKRYGLKKIVKPATKTIYRVQTGAFSNKTYAEDYLKKVKAAGFDAYMVKINGMYKIQVGAFENKVYAEDYMKKVKAAGFDAFITTESGEAVPVNDTPVKKTYTFTQFVTDVQKAIGATADGIPGNETLSKTVTLSRYINQTHAAVLPVQKWLYELGYTEIGTADGEAGPAFEKAVIRYQKDIGCYADGEITAMNATWKALLRL